MREKPEWVDRSDLKDIVAQSTTTSQVLVKLNLVPAGGNYAVLHRWLKLLGISTSHFTQKGKRMERLTLDSVFRESSTASNDAVKNRMVSDLKVPYLCAMCGIDSWRSLPISLELDHVDGNNTNNLISNLRLLCPNCHSQTPNFRGRNARRCGSKRLSRAGLSRCGCGLPIDPKATRCKACHLKVVGKNWPSDDEFVKMVNDSYYSAVARQLGVSNTSVQRRYARLTNKVVGPSGIAPA